MRDYFSLDARVMEPSPIRKLSKYNADPEIISFAGGHPALEAFPAGELQDLFGTWSRVFPRPLLQYGLTRGNGALIGQIIERCLKKGIPARTEQVVLVSGSQRGLDLIGRVLFDPDDVVLVEIPSYPGALACLRNLRVRLVGVNQDVDGLDLSHLRAVIAALKAEGKRAKALYTIPNFQNPSGATLAADRRSELVRIAREEEFLILEDDPYGDLWFSAEDEALVRPMAASGDERIVYMSSFSKILAPGLRTGFIIADAAIAERLELAAQASDLCSSTLDQAIILALMENGTLEKNLERIRTYYRGQAEVILAALARHMPAGVSWNAPRGGFFLWMTLGAIDSDRLLEDCIAHKLTFVPGRSFCVDGSGGNALRLSFSKETPERIERGIAMLGERIRAQG